MKKLRLIAGVAALLISGLGCGQTYSGTYTGTETIGLNSTGIGVNSPNQITINIIQTSNDDVSGTWQGTYGTGTFTGRPEGSRINAVSLTMQQSAMVSASGVAILTNSPIISTTNTAPTANQLTCGPYIGILNRLTPTSLDGTLILQTSTTALPNGANLVTSSQCPQIRKISATR